MANAISAREKFQALLRELFQFDCADLDFGIYRIMNHKRAVIEEFIENDLLALVTEEIASGALAGQSEAAGELATARREVREAFGPNAITGDGEIESRFRETPLGKKYAALQGRSGGAADPEEIEADLFNRLYEFFRRYYRDGDFVPQGRGAGRAPFSIPYDGAEVHFHWANRGQYYVKSADRFRHYAFTVAGVSVRFDLRSAELEHNDVKVEGRFFVPLVGEAELTEDSGRPSLRLPFEYRSFEAEKTPGLGPMRQDALLERAASDLLEKLKGESALAAALSAAHPTRVADRSLSVLEHHLRRYARRNTSDFFIHRNLRAFLEREFDFYLKNEIGDLYEVEATGTEAVRRWLHKTRVLKRVGARIIVFLDQIESFQKMLWEKRKFVTATHYCIAVGQVGTEFLPALAANEAQWTEWRNLVQPESEDDRALMSASGPEDRRIRFLERNPSLLLDTSHFDPEFTERLLASFDDLDGLTDGLLVHGDNFHALTLLAARYRGAARCAYIDPPYNTGESEILYKNGYLHSSWLTLIENRVTAAMPLMADPFTLFVAIDDFEMSGLSALLDGMGRIHREMIVVNHHPQGGKSRLMATTHEYMLACFGGRTPMPLKARTGDGEVELRPFKRAGTAESNFRRWRPNSFYAIVVDPSTNEVVGLESPPSGGPGSYDREKTPEGYSRIYPIGAGGEERVWRRSYESCLKLVESGALRCSGRGTIYQSIAAEDKTSAVFSNWTGPRYNAGTFGANLLGGILGARNAFPYPKSIHTVEDAIVAGRVGAEDTCLDYFAGSGTTGHAVINLNREDGGRRRFVLVEVGDYFDRVILPRIKRVAFTPEWKDGRPKRSATKEEAARGPRIVKYVRLESYDDALDNIAFDRDAARAGLGFEDYRLQYMLKWETKRCETMLNAEALSSPFGYRLRSFGNGDEMVKTADAPETFNYLIGLRVRTRRVFRDDDRRYLVYAGEARRRRTVVIWRDTRGWGEKELARDHRFVEEKEMTKGAEEVFINSPKLVRDAKELEPEFKRLMFATIGN